MTEIVYEQRFLTDFRSRPSGTPGLVMQNDGTIQVVQPDGVRVNLAPVAGYRAIFGAIALLVGSVASFPVSGGAAPTGGFQGIATGPPMPVGASAPVFNSLEFSVQGIPTSTTAFGLDAQMFVGNLACTEMIRVEVVVNDFVPSPDGGGSYTVDWRTAEATALAGSDLTWLPDLASPSGNVVSAAGGVFVSALNFGGFWNT